MLQNILDDLEQIALRLGIKVEKETTKMFLIIIYMAYRSIMFL